jgi:hypothetical protein
LRIADPFPTSLLRLLLLAAVLHVALAIAIALVGKSRILPHTLDSHGVGISFALDSVSYREQAVEMARLLREGKFRDWINYRAPLATFHARVYSISYALLGWLLGEGVLAIEPINLFYYLSILVLTYLVGATVFSPTVGRLTVAVIGLWPSLLIFTTQLMRDPIFIAAFLLLLFSLVVCIKQKISFKQAFACAGAGWIALFLILLVRSTMWEVVVATVLLAFVVCVMSQIAMRRFDATKTVAIVLLCVAFFLLPRIMSGRRVADRFERATPVDARVRSSTREGTPWTRVAAQIGWVRHQFITRYASAGANLDTDVELQTPGDMVRYLPRAIEIGLLAPFPSMWFSPGKEVGLSGRLVIGAEMLGCYLLLGLACLTLMRERRRLVVWFLFASAVLGSVALAYAVVNAGALYRLRYPYFIPIILLAAQGYVEWRHKHGWPTGMNGSLHKSVSPQ